MTHPTPNGVQTMKADSDCGRVGAIFLPEWIGFREE